MFNQICGQSVLDLLNKSKTQKSLSTSSCALDSLLAGCLSRCGLYEFIGAPSCGKTQVCLQILANFLQQELGDVLFIDSDANFNIERLMQMLPVTETCRRESFLERIRYVLCEDYVEVLAELLVIDENKVCDNGRLSLLIIDDFGSLLRTALNDRKYFATTNQLGTLLLKLIRSMSLRVVLTNTVITGWQLSAETDGMVIPESSISARTFEEDVCDSSGAELSGALRNRHPETSAKRMSGVAGASINAQTFDNSWSHYPTVRVLLGEAATQALRSYTSKAPKIVGHQQEQNPKSVREAEQVDETGTVYATDIQDFECDDVCAVDLEAETVAEEEEDSVLLYAQIIKAPFCKSGKSTLFRLDRRGIRDAV